MEDYQPQLKEAFRATSIIGYFTSLSVIVYGLIAYFLLSRYSMDEQTPDRVALMTKLIGGLGGLMFIGMAFLRPTLLKINRPQEQTTAGFIRQLQAAAMVVYGLCETISILGLILSMITRNMQNYYWMAFLSLLAFGIYFPKYSNWDRHLRGSLNSVFTDPQ